MKYKILKYKFIIPCYVYDCHCFEPGDTVSIKYINVSADNCRDVIVEYKGNEYNIPIDAFLISTVKLK